MIDSERCNDEEFEWSRANELKADQKLACRGLLCEFVRS
jgi:hypothetical protein